MASLKNLIPILPFFILLAVLSPSCEARDILVGGNQDSWKIPSSNDALNKWASSVRFRVGDSLLWKYDGKKDSVLEVSEQDYKACSTSKPINKFNDGDTKIKLNRSGPFYFISGEQDHCKKGEKLEVVVMSEKHQPSPSPAITPATAPAPASHPSGASAGGVRVFGLVVGFVLSYGVMWL